ncbi:MAG: hypothetical protein U0232_28045 [Thermomicrobiales bacterium]
MTSEMLPGGRTIAFTYDANGNLATLAPPSKPAHTFTYNDLNQIASYVLPTVPLVPAFTASFTYNLDHQPLLTTYPTGRTLGDNYYPRGVCRASTSRRAIWSSAMTRRPAC